MPLFVHVRAPSVSVFKFKPEVGMALIKRPLPYIYLYLIKYMYPTTAPEVDMPALSMSMCEGTVLNL